MKEAVKTLAAAPETELLRITKVKVDIPETDLPGFSRNKTRCSLCGEQILDGRETLAEDKPVCRACASDPTTQP